MAGDSDAGVELVESLDDLVAEIVDDSTWRTSAGTATIRSCPEPEAPRTRPGVVKTPPPSCGPPSRIRIPGPPQPSVRRRATWSGSLEPRKRRRGILGYDDLLTRLADALDEPDAPARLRMHTAGRL